MNEPSSASTIPAKHRARFRRAGVLVLVLGIGGACVLYWMRTRQQDLSNDAMMAGYSKPELRQMEILYGKMGLMITELKEDLKRPGTQAILIGMASVIVASGCFLMGREPEE